MNVAITGHRKFKLEAYDIPWIKTAIGTTLLDIARDNYVTGYSGMASGVDLWFLQSCEELNCRWVACIPFESQSELMDDDKELADRDYYIAGAEKAMYIRNSAMVEKADLFIVVWDGNKGGTHNVVQQLIENKKNFYWINPVAKIVWECFSNEIH